MATEVGMYPVIEDVGGGRLGTWRQVQLRVGPPDPWEFSGVAWRIVAWDHSLHSLSCFRVPNVFRPKNPVKDTWHLDQMGLDLATHAAFCRGDMPGPVYADWIEENVRDFPAVGLALLRGWIDHPDLR